MSKQSLIAVSYGGGVNSTALLIEMHRRNVRPDVIIFSDTGGELPETYRFVDEFSNWLVERDFPEIIKVQSIVHGKADTLEAHCLRYESLPSLAYGFKSCSARFKVEPQERWMRHYEPAKKLWKSGGKVLKLLGFDAGERRRVKERIDKRYYYGYPLVEWGWDRRKCREVVIEVGLKPAKSACFFCPASKKHEILKLAREHPDLYERAIEMEDQADLHSIKGLGRNFSWRDLVNADQAQLRLFEEIWDDMPCGCYDG